MGTDNCFCFGKSNHMVKYCPMEKNQGSENNQAQESGLNSDDPKRYSFNALKSRGDEEGYPDVFTDIL